LIKIDYSQQSQAASTNLKTLLLLEIALLSWNDFDWSPPAAVAGRLPDGAVLGAAATADNDNDSGQEQSAAAAPAPAASTAAKAPAAAPAAPVAILDVNDFITWTLDKLWKCIVDM
jgi:hypothetical protein